MAGRNNALSTANMRAEKASDSSGGSSVRRRALRPATESEKALDSVLSSGGSGGRDRSVVADGNVLRPRAFLIDMNEGGEEIQKALTGPIVPSQANDEAWEEVSYTFEGRGVIAPMYDKGLLIRTVDKSGIVKECIEVYKTVIEGYGHSFVSVLDPDTDDAREQVKWSLWARRVRESEDDNPRDIPEPTDAEIDAEISALKREIRFQKMEAERFFSNCARHEGRVISMVELRQLLRGDYEEVGECYVEVLRDEPMEVAEGESEIGDPRRLQYLPAVGMRQFPRQEHRIPVEVPERVDSFSVEEVTEFRGFRLFVQTNPIEASTVFFKEFGDPRIYSARTGKQYPTWDALQDEEATKAEGLNGEVVEVEAPEATEIMYWKQYHSMTSYGVPRWVCRAPTVTGLRAWSEVSADFFDNKAIPPAVVLVSGGRLADDADEKIKEHLKGIKGKSNFHKVLVLEAMPFNAGLPGQTPHRTQLEFKSMMGKTPEEASHLKYKEAGERDIGATFRVPPILRGRVEEYTRATAREALRFFLEMVARPEQHRFDSSLNAGLMLALGFHLVMFRSKGPDISDPEAMSGLLDVLLEHGVIVPAEGRPVAERLLGENLQPANQPWQRLPLKMTLANMKSESTSGAPANDNTQAPTNAPSGGVPDGTEDDTPDGSGSNESRPDGSRPDGSELTQAQQEAIAAGVRGLRQTIQATVKGDLQGWMGRSSWVDVPTIDTPSAT